MPALLATADAYVLPSRWEGMPYVLLEAMAAARPIVATPVDGARELVRRSGCGRIADAVSAAALAAELRALLAQPAAERERMGAAGRACVEQHYTLERMLEGTLAVYRELA